MKGRKLFFQFCALKAYQLPPEEFAYFTQLMFAYLGKGAALSDLDLLRLTGALTSKQINNFYKTLQQHFYRQDGLWFNDDLEEHIKLANDEEQMWIRAERTSKARSLAGKKGQKVKKGESLESDPVEPGVKLEAKDKAMFEAMLQAKLAAKSETNTPIDTDFLKQLTENKEEKSVEPLKKQTNFLAMPQAKLETMLERKSEMNPIKHVEKSEEDNTQLIEKSKKTDNSFTCAYLVSRAGNRTELTPCNSVPFRSDSIPKRSTNPISIRTERSESEKNLFFQIQKTFESQGLFRPGILSNREKIWQLIDQGLSPDIAKQAAKTGREKKNVQNGIDFRFCIHYVLTIAENLLISIQAQKDLAEQKKHARNHQLDESQQSELEALEAYYAKDDQRVTWRIM